MKMALLEKTFVNNPIWNIFTKYALYRPFLRKIKQEPQNILELGSGIGKTTMMIQERFPEAKITATDYDETQVTKAKQMNKNENITFQQEDAQGLSFSDNTFDAVFVLLTFHHLEDYKKALKECYRVLKGHGLLYIVDLGKYSVHRLQKIFPSPVIFSKHDFTQAVIEAGFKIFQSSGNNIRFFITAQKVVQ